MKKIVALVLALVLALSLATVAFAAEETGYLAATADSKLKLENVTMKEVKAAGTQNVAVYNLTVSVNGKEFPLLGNFAAATADDYDCVVVMGDKVVYLKNTVTGGFTGEAALTKVVAKADAKCGDIYAADGVTLYDYNGKIMKAAASWNLGIAANKAVKDHVTEKIQDITFTKADWEKAVTDFIFDEWNEKDGRFIWDTEENLVKNLTDMAGRYIEYAKANYGHDVDPTNIFELVPALWNTLFSTTAGSEGAFPWTAKFGLFGMPADAADEIIEKVTDALEAKYGISYDPTSAYDRDELNTDADYNGSNLGLNLVREFLKPACTIKAVALVDGKLVTLANATAATTMTKSYDTKTGALSVKIDGDYYVIPHTYAVDYATVAGKTAITKVYCETCGAEFEFVVGDETAATKVFGVGNYVNITNEFKDAFTTKFLGKHITGWDWNTMSFSAGWTEGTGYTWNMFDTASRSIKEALDGGSLWISAAAAAAEKPADTGVTSADTFDAGIALYAGMALMSVTGSAIVIGKKKEF